MANRDVIQLVGQCTRFLNGHPPKSVRDRALEVAQSDLALKRNDQYGSGGFVTEFEQEVAGLLGKEAAVFMPSGTMAQQIALRIWSDESGHKKIAFHPTSHLHIHEQMAYAFLHGLEGVLLGEANRLFTQDDLRGVSDGLAALLIELPQREIGGQLPTWEEFSAICEFAKARNIRLHMDGARLWECAPYYQRSYAEIAEPFDSVYVSMYKILGGFPGAVLAGPGPFVEQARIWLRRHGGNLQQQSVAAISAKLGLDSKLPRIPLYVKRAGEIADILRGLEGVRLVPEHPPTNMMHVYFARDPERWVGASLQIADEDKVWLFGGISADGKWELNVGDGALEFEIVEIERCFQKLRQLAG